MNTFPNVKKKNLKTPPYLIDKRRLQRFDPKNIIFQRVSWDQSWDGYGKMYDERVPSIVNEDKPGYSRIDFALAYASWTVHDAFKEGVSWKKVEKFKDPVATSGIDWTESKFEVKNPRSMKLHLKRAAKLLGASITGVCKLNRDWLYAGIEVPKKFENAIVMAIEMDPEGISTSPAAPAAAATGVGYSKMSFTLAGVGEFIRNLGYSAIQCGNDTALSIPLAIDSGLGELGRNGLLITPQYGPRIRLCKIFTNLPLESDKPIKFGVYGFCKKCKLCAKNCEVEAISMDDEPTFDVKYKSNNLGAKKWFVDFESCYLYWCENGVDCSTCIKVCPYNTLSSNKILPPEGFWHI